MVRFMRSTMPFVQWWYGLMPFLDAIELADALEDVTDACVGDAASEAFLSCKGHAVVRQNGMYAVREGH